MEYQVTQQSTLTSCVTPVSTGESNDGNCLELGTEHCQPGADRGSGVVQTGDCYTVRYCSREVQLLKCLVHESRQDIYEELNSFDNAHSYFTFYDKYNQTRKMSPSTPLDGVKC